MAVLFISDLHIDSGRPDIGGQFIEFLGSEARDADALYILGDLFESWVGDDAPDDGQAAALDGIRSLTSAGVPCFVMHGNRDFLFGRTFCERTGAKLLPDPVIVTLYGEAVLVMHGDALCTDDRAYQRLRATVRDRDWQRRFLRLSAAQRRALAGAARTGSQTHTASIAYTIGDVNVESVAAVMRAAGVATLLHGHTHRPGIHPFEVDGRACTRIVLGDWYTQGSVLTWDASGPELRSLPRESRNENETAHRHR
ncbi:MAG TPA: UDP-2,3-diacylglucosamine diphosphatase [Steroidobacteraceae bacterium]|jgi:UDP-2,3-diacylglucosamine hydrolase|nr:UDP-2,3-diacylglucosamine diphosphatase [Steroidobacteraceae bacterium]